MKNIVLLAALFLIAIPAAAQNTWDWSSPGSLGVVDAGTWSLGLYSLSGTTFAPKPTAIATVVARYPVTNTNGSSDSLTPGWTTLQMSYRDNSSTAGSVVAILYEVEKCTATQTQLCSITSSDGDGSTTCSTCEFAGGLDFANNAYYVEVTVTKTDVPADPALYQLAIY